MIFRLSQKLAKKIKEAPSQSLPPDPNPFADWSAHLFTADGKDRSGKRLKILSPEMRRIFGDFGGKVSIQRSPPRWVEPAFTARAAEFVRPLGHDSLPGIASIDLARSKRAFSYVITHDTGFAPNPYCLLSLAVFPVATRESDAAIDRGLRWLHSRCPSGHFIGRTSAVSWLSCSRISLNSYLS